MLAQQAGVRRGAPAVACQAAPGACRHESTFPTAPPAHTRTSSRREAPDPCPRTAGLGPALGQKPFWDQLEAGPPRFELRTAAPLVRVRELSFRSNLSATFKYPFHPDPFPEPFPPLHRRVVWCGMSQCSAGQRSDALGWFSNAEGELQ